MVLRLARSEDFEALLLGAAIYATGGGGDLERGLLMVKEVFIDRSRVLEVRDVEELDASAFIASPYDVGTIAPSTKLRKAARVSNTVAEALRIFRDRLGVEVMSFNPVELGGGNTAVALYAAGLANLPVVDGDRVGRAAPEIHQDTAVLMDRKCTPSVAVTPTGIEVVILDYPDIDDYEAMLRHLSILSGTHVTVVDTPMRVEEARNVLIRGTLSKCYELGKKVLEARQRGAFVPQIVAETMNGWIVFHGIVREWRWRNEGGFLVGEMIIEGIDEFRGRVLKSWIKNEHIMVWLNDQPLVMPPDLFTLVSRDGNPVLNHMVREGMEVWGVAAPAPAVWRCEEGLKLFGPKHFGFDYDYVPVEKLVRDLGLA